MDEVKVITVKQTIKPVGFGRSKVVELPAVEFPNRKVALLQNDDVVVYLSRDLMVKDLNKEGVTRIEDWITSTQAAHILTEKSGHVVTAAYVRVLHTRLGKFASKGSGHSKLYNRFDVEAYQVQVKPTKSK